MIAAPDAPGEQPFPRMTRLQAARWKPLRKLLFDFASPANVRALRIAIAQFEPDLVHVHNIYGIGSQMVRVASRHAPTVVTVHDYWPIDVFVPRVRYGRLSYPLRQQLLFPWVLTHRALHKNNLREATLVSPSRYLAQRLDHSGYRGVRAIPNGVTLPEETAASEASILFVGRLVPEKGLQKVLGSLEHVARELSWRVDIVGDGPLRAGLEREHPSVRFHGRADPAPFYRRAGLALLPSLWPENFPYAVLEAMAYGVPVLASSVGGIPEIVENGVTGLLCDPDAPEQVVAAVRELASDGALRERLGRAARERIEREYTWATIGPRYAALYKELLGERARMRTAVRVG
jgi:glycosyltransferase involved in cell wall biosynthesis